MRIAHIHIENFRNFHTLDIEVGRSGVILGENQIGKTNLICALRLVLDPSLPDSARQLRLEDFWDGVARPLTTDTRILISIDITDFEDNEEQLAVLAEHLVQPEPMIARLSYEFGSIPGLDHAPSKDDDFEFTSYGGDRKENRVGYDLRKRIPMEVLHALRDAESDLARWTKSPLKPLIDRAKAALQRTELDDMSEAVSVQRQKLAELKPISDLAQRINKKLIEMAGMNQAIETSLGFSPTDPDKLLRALRLLFDGKKRDISEASLGTANILYLALTTLELESLVDEGSREHTFFAIEEPEAHLHPHLQRLVYRNYLRPKQTPVTENKAAIRPITYVLTTHSPHIASVTPIDSIILLRKDNRENATIGVSGAAMELTDVEREDIERYLDVTRAEGLFARRILLVEGDAEKFLVPALAAKLGCDLDSLGISVCSVAGTNFAPYVKFFGPKGLDIPFAVLTDLDPCLTKDPTHPDFGRSRAHSLCSLVNSKAKLPKEIQESFFYESYSIFINNYTLEIDLYMSGGIRLMNEAMQALCDVEAAKKRFQKLADDTKKAKAVVPLEDPQRFINDIEYVGKGRFAQRLANAFRELDPKHKLCPPYIEKAIKHVTS
jgi:putative ATP-dependent endonuclease of OLD family